MIVNSNKEANDQVTFQGICFRDFQLNRLCLKLEYTNIT